MFIQTGIAALQLQAFNKLKPAEVILFPEPMLWAVVGGSGGEGWCRYQLKTVEV